MEPETPLIARIRLARSPVRLYALTALLLVAAAGLGLVAWLGPLVLGEPGWIALVAAAGGLVLAAAVAAARPATLRLDVTEAAVRIQWLGGEQRYALEPGRVTRVRLRGDGASSLRTHGRRRGWQHGAARLRDEEEIEVIRLANTPTVILVPTDRGRLAIGAASEQELIDALSHAARARQRAEELEASAVEPPAAVPPPEPEPHVLTGIERALMEEQLARERESVAASRGDGALTAETDDQAAARPDPQQAPAFATGTNAVAAPRSRWARGGRSSNTIDRVRARIGRPRPSAAFVLLPLIGAGAVWGAATAFGRLPEPATDLGRLTALGLVLAGPATSVGAIVARAWWPRLVGIVVTSGLAASVFVGRALLGA